MGVPRLTAIGLTGWPGRALTGGMQRIWTVVLLVLMVWGTVSCASFKGRQAGSAKQPVLTPDLRLTGTVVSVNPVGRFVVLRFPGGRLPAVGQPLAVYRDGLRVGELKVTGPQREEHIVADITAGEVRVGDEVRSN